MVKQISIFLENKPGMLDKACEILAKEGIDIRALTVAETADFGLLRMITSDPDKAVSALNREGLSSIEHEVLAVELNDEPGGLHQLTKILADAGMNIEYVYAFVSRNAGKAYVVLRPEDIEKTKNVLEEKSVKLVSEKEIEGI